MQTKIIPQLCSKAFTKNCCANWLFKLIFYISHSERVRIVDGCQSTTGSKALEELICFVIRASANPTIHQGGACDVGSVVGRGSNFKERHEDSSRLIETFEQEVGTGGTRCTSLG